MTIPTTAFWHIQPSYRDLQRRREGLGKAYDSDQGEQQAGTENSGPLGGRWRVRFLVVGFGRQEVIAVPDGLDENERAVERQRDGCDEDKLRRTEKRTWHARCEVWQNEGEYGERGQNGKCGARCLNLKPLFAMARATPEQAQCDDAVAHNHNGGKTVSRASPPFSGWRCNHN